MELHVAQAEITTMEVDAVVMPCTSMGSVTEPIRSHLPSAATTGIEEELKSKVPIALGAAMLAGAEAFGAKNAILVPIQKHQDDTVATEHIRRAVRAALMAANVKRFETLALPNLVQPDSRTTRAEVARAVVQEVRGHELAFPEVLYLVDTEADMVRIFQDAVAGALHSSQI